VRSWSSQNCTVRLYFEITRTLSTGQIRYFATQDVINLIMGGNAARVFEFRLPMPYHRMSTNGKPGNCGANWQDSMADSN